MLKMLWNDTRGGIISMELVLLASLIAAGILGGMSKFSRGIANEFNDLGDVVTTQSAQIAATVHSSNSDSMSAGTEFYFLDSRTMWADEEFRPEELRPTESTD